MTDDANRIKLQGFLEDKLKWHDYTHIVVADDDMPKAQWFIHTVGRARSDQPELILTGPVEPQQAMDLIGDVAAYERRVGQLPVGTLPADAARQRLRLVDASNPFVLEKRVAQASSRFGSGIRVLQVLWPDHAGHFPDDPAYDEQGCPQQLLGAP
ncbi:DUF4262 domain-containing protein [Castellaniella sp.]|uniref:DUF4262 domain-containing protein n=1 Tax=Castellaniella sp. TaxID=1955812 RepID=UPI0035693831